MHINKTKLCILENGPIMSYNSTAGVIAENENVIITCSLNHNGSVPPGPTLRPYFHWTDSNGHHVSSSYDKTTANAAVSQLTITAGRQNITSNTCNVYLQLIPLTTPGYASNTPTVNSSASSLTIEVLCK